MGVAVAIFWATLAGILLFIIGAICKGLVAVLNGILIALSETLVVAAVAAAVVIVLFLLTMITEGIFTNGFWSTLQSIILLGIIAGSIGAVAAGLGGIILAVVLSVLTVLITLIIDIFEKFADLSDQGYQGLLQVINKQLEKY